MSETKVTINESSYPATDWTVTFTGLNSQPTVTFAKYIKIGQWVWCTIRTSNTAVMTATGPFGFNVPFASKAATFVQDIMPVPVTYGVDSYFANLQLNGGTSCGVYLMTEGGSSKQVFFGNFGIGNAVGFTTTIQFGYLADS